MSILVDLTVLLIIGFVVWWSAKRGFVRTVLEVVGYVLAVAAALWLGGVLAGAVFDSMLAPGLVAAIEGHVKNTVTTGDVTEVIEAVPAIFRGTLDAGKITASIHQHIGAGAHSAAVVVVENFIRPIAVTVLRALITMVLFLPLMLVIRLLVKWLSKLFDLPIIGKVNRTLGGVIGLVKGTIIAYLFCVVVNALVEMSKNGYLFFTRESIGSSFLFKALSSLSPF